MSGKSKKKSRRGEEQSTSDSTVENAQSNDAIVVIIGPSGAGKSTFINIATKTDVMNVGHGLMPCTTNIQHVMLRDPYDYSRRIILVDTPGFDDASEEDSEILQRIAVWLARSYNRNMKLAGVIYLRSIALNRVCRTLRMDLTLLRGLCSQELMTSIVLVTTHWAKIEAEMGQQRERELSVAFWKGAAGHGSRTVQFQDTRESAWDIIDLVVGKGKRPTTATEPEILIPGTVRGGDDMATHSHDFQEPAEYLKFTSGGVARVPVSSEQWPSPIRPLSTLMRDNWPERVPCSRNIVIFGETGAGKSSLVNMIVGSDVAATSQHASACTLDARDYDVYIDSQKYRIYDTVGLNEPKKMEQNYHHLDAIEKAYRLFASVTAVGGIHLLILCFRAGRLTEAVRQTYQLFYDFICESKVPVALVVTHVEKVTPMDAWWPINQPAFDSCGIRPITHACITTIMGNDVAQQRKYEESKVKVHELLRRYGAGQPFIKEKVIWTGSVIRMLGEMLESIHVRPPRHSTKGMVQYLTRNGLMSKDDAEAIAARIRRVDSDTDSISGDGRFRLFT